jgi:beta-xylosidase
VTQLRTAATRPSLGHRRVGVAAALVLLLAACGGGGSGDASRATATGDPPAGGSGGGSAEAPAASGQPSPVAPEPSGEASTPAESAAARTPGADEFTNPVYDEPLADPYILAVDGTYYAYGTKGFEATDFATVRSMDLVSWEELPTALPELPEWSTGRTWAPEVAPVGDGYVMYFSTNAPDIPNPFGDPSQCVAAAVSDEPEGPFVVPADEPLVCQPELGGSIDATWFEDADGARYLIWKNDGNCCGIPTQFFIQPLSEDGLTLTGDPSELGLENDELWEGQVIEAPSMYERDGTYYLFYSGGHFGTSQYAVGYATSDTVTGPFRDAEENPILVTKAPAAGPGHQTIFEDDDGDLWMAYHAWDIARVGEQVGGARKMWLDELEFENGRPIVRGPDAGPQPAP